MKLRRFTSAGEEMTRQFLSAVHEVGQTYSDSWTSLGSDGAFDLGDIYLPMGDIDLSGDWDCRDWLKEGVDWWRKEIAFYAKITSNKVSCRSKETESATWLKVTMGI